MTTFPAAPEATIGLISTMSGKMPPQLQHEADTVQALLQAAVDETQPAVIFHGHWHQQNRCRLNARSEVVGLAADGHPVGAENSAVVVEVPRCGPMLSPRVPNLVPIPGPRMERETPGQRPRPNYGHPRVS